MKNWTQEKGKKLLRERYFVKVTESIVNYKRHINKNAMNDDDMCFQ